MRRPSLWIVEPVLDFSLQFSVQTRFFGGENDFSLYTLRHKA